MPALRRWPLIASLILLCCTLLSACQKQEPPPEAKAPLDKSPIRLLDLGQEPYEGGLAAVARFSTAIDLRQSPGDWLNLSRADGEPVEGGWISAEHDKTLYFPRLEPNQSYRLTLKAGLPAQNGSRLAEDKNLSFTTGDLAQALGFASRGNLLPEKLSDGLPVISLNTPEAEVDFYRVKPERLQSFLGRFGERSQLELWRAQDVLEEVDLVYSGRFDLEAPRNQRVTRYLPVQEIKALQPAGLYLAIMRAPGAVEYRYPATWFAVTDLGLQVRRYSDSIELWVQNLSEAKPVANVDIELIGAKNKRLAAGSTDTNGHLRLAQSWASNQQPHLLIARQGDHTSLVRLAGPALDLSAYPLAGRPFQPQELFLYGPRDLYRPGETLVLSGLLRDHNGQSLPATPLPGKLISPEGQTLSSLNWQPQAGGSDSGYYELRLPLPQSAPLGQWHWQVTLPDGSQAQYPFQVEAFLPERMRLELSLPEQRVRPQQLSAAIEGAYLYGAPAADNRLQSQLWQRHEPHPFSHYPAYFFGNPDLEGQEQHLELDELRLDTDGKAALKLPNSWQQLNSPVRLNLYASLLESGGRPVTRRASGLILPAKELLGIRPLFEDGHSPGEGLARFSLIKTDGSGLMASGPLELKLVREQRNYFWLWEEDQGWHRDYSERQYPVYQEQISLDDKQPLEVALPVEWGYYRLELHDPQHPERSSRYRFYAGWGDEQRGQGPEQLQLSFDRSSYRPGETATIQVQAPTSGQGYVLVEGERPLYWAPFELKENQGTLELPIGADWARQDLYVSLVLVQPGDQQDSSLPRRMLGIAPLPLDKSDRLLAVNLEAPAKVRPQTTLSTRIQVRDSAGQAPQQAWVTLAAVDVGVLNISQMATPDAADWFFNQRRYSPELYDSFGALIEAEAGARAKLRFGGDADLTRGGSEPVSDVQIVALYSGQIALDASGEAQVELEIPEFNGELRLMALAFDAERYGKAEQALTVAAPLVTQLAKPRFLASGDQTELLLELHNLSGQAQQLQLSFSLGEGLSFSGDNSDPKLRSETLELAIGAKAKVKLPVIAGEKSAAVALALELNGLKLAENPEPETLKRHWQLGIRPAWAAETRSLRTMIEPGARFSPDAALMAGLLPQTLRAILELAPQPPLPIADHFQALKAYPYGCAEQTTSGVFAQLYLDRAKLAALGLEGSDDAERQKAIRTAIARLQGMHKSDGSFGLWNRDNPSEPWLTAYLADFLLRAQDLGYAVPQQPLAETLDRLQRYLRQSSPIRRYYWSGRSGDDLAVRAYAAQVLASRNRAPLGQLTELYRRHKDSQQGLALVQLGLALHRQGNAALAEQALTQGLERLQREPSEQQFSDYGSSLRDRALALFWLREAEDLAPHWRDSALVLIPLIGDELAERRWFSTQERNALVLAGLWLQQDKNAAPLKGTISLNGSREALSGQELRRQIDGTKLSTLELHNQADRPLYLNLALQGRGPSPIATPDAPIQVERRYFDLKGQPLQNLKQLRSGDSLLVELSVARSEHEPLPHLLLIDLLPAGLELENQNLATSLDLDELRIDGEPLSELWYQSEPTHQEFRDDRYVAALDLGWRSSARVFYLARAVSPGRYRIPPTFAEEMYRPWIRFQGADQGWLEIKAR